MKAGSAENGSLQAIKHLVTTLSKYHRLKLTPLHIGRSLGEIKFDSVIVAPSMRVVKISQDCYKPAIINMDMFLLMRSATYTRTTKETSISVELQLDGHGRYDIQTGIGFLDHMLEQLSRHSLMDLTVKCQGDLHIDGHHTTEDTAIAIGQAFSEALGDRKGITRYGHAYIPMDETLSRVAVDLSNRPYCVWNVTFSQPKLGDMDSELFREWFFAFATHGGLNLHVENLYGINNHHIIESCYKGLAKALRTAISIDERQREQVPSTKGKLGEQQNEQ